MRHKNTHPAQSARTGTNAITGGGVVTAPRTQPPASDATGAPAPEHEHRKTAAEPKQDDIAALAYALWQSRGCPIGSPEEDWFRAVQQLQSRN